MAQTQQTSASTASKRAHESAFSESPSSEDDSGSDVEVLECDVVSENHSAAIALAKSSSARHLKTSHMVRVKLSVSPPKSTDPPPFKVVKTHPMFTAVSARPTALFQWRAPVGSLSTCYHGTYRSPLPSKKVAAFDLDGTLIKTKYGGKFPRNKDDWVIWSDRVIPKLRQAHAEGFAIVILTNQNLIPTRLEWVRQKIPIVAEELEVPFHVFAATGKDQFRKPDTGMWDAFVDLFNEGVAVDLKASFFVGDAAGRARDHSDSDLQMAKQVKISFLTPEEYFR